MCVYLSMPGIASFNSSGVSFESKSILFRAPNNLSTGATRYEAGAEKRVGILSEFSRLIIF